MDAARRLPRLGGHGAFFGLRALHHPVLTLLVIVIAVIVVVILQRRRR